MSAPETSQTKKTESTGGATVVVASKLPMDIILRLYAFKMKHEPVMGGGVREFKIAEPRNDVKGYIIQGNSFPQNKGPHQQLVSGYAITRDIPKAFWDEWFEQNKDADYVVNGMIFAHAQNSSALAQAREMEGEKSGLERLDPANLPKGLKTSDDVRRAA